MASGRSKPTTEVDMHMLVAIINYSLANTVLITYVHVMFQIFQHIWLKNLKI